MLVLLGIPSQLWGYQVCLRVLVQGSFRTHPFGKTETVQRNRSFPEGIRFQDYKVNMGIVLPLSHHVNWWGKFGWIQGYWISLG